MHNANEAFVFDQNFKVMAAVVFEHTPPETGA